MRIMQRAQDLMLGGVGNSASTSFPLKITIDDQDLVRVILVRQMMGYKQPRTVPRMIHTDCILRPICFCCTYRSGPWVGLVQTYTVRIADHLQTLEHREVAVPRSGFFHTMGNLPIISPEALILACFLCSDHDFKQRAAWPSGPHNRLPATLRDLYNNIIRRTKID